MRLLASFCTSLCLLSCTAYEYEEEIFFEVDGAGTIRVSGSQAILREVYGVTSADAIRELFEDPSIEIDSVRQTKRGENSYLHVQGRFSDWNRLCRHPVFRHRGCRLDVDENEDWVLSLSVPAVDRDLPRDVAPDDSLAFRFHFPSQVSFHNSPNDIERGNIVRWERKASEHFGGEDLVVEARFGRRSVLATTVSVLGTAAAIVALAIGIALAWMVRKGRRQLAEGE